MRACVRACVCAGGRVCLHAVEGGAPAARPRPPAALVGARLCGVCAVTRVRAARRILQAPSGMRHGCPCPRARLRFAPCARTLCELNRAGGVDLWSCLCCMPRFAALPRHKPRTHSKGRSTGGSAAHSMIQGRVCTKQCTQRPPRSARSVPRTHFWKAILKFVPNPERHTTRHYACVRAWACGRAGVGMCVFACSL